MKKTLRKLLWITGALIVATVAITVYMVSPPILYDKDGSLAWDNVMTLEGPNHSYFLPVYKTQYDVAWGGISIDDQQDFFLKLTIWNGYGIADVQVRGVHDREDSSTLMVHRNIGVGLGISTDWGGRYRLIYLRPLQEEKEFLIRVVDRVGNITTAWVKVPSNEYLKFSKKNV